MINICVTIYCIITLVCTYADDSNNCLTDQWSTDIQTHEHTYAEVTVISSATSELKRYGHRICADLAIYYNSFKCCISGEIGTDKITTYSRR